MKITLNTQELNQAVVDYLSNQGLTIDTTKVSIVIDDEGVTIDTAANTHAPAKPKKEKKESVKPTPAEPVEETTETIAQEPVSVSDNDTASDDVPVAKPDTRALFGSHEHTDDVLEDDTPQIPKESSVEKTRKLFS